MPTISRFNGIRILMFFQDHLPAHFHAEAADAWAVVDIATLTVAQGSLPPAQMALVLGWAAAHRAELMVCWGQAVAGVQPNKIAPL